MSLALLAAIALNSIALPETQATPLPSLRTRWAADVKAPNVHQEYPRPQMVRSNWVNLNGYWDLSIISLDSTTQPRTHRILVPFPVESQLSGVDRMVAQTEGLLYRRTFSRPKVAPGERVLLNFGAVDWEAIVHLNGKQVGVHNGGFDPFTFDITDALTPSGEQVLSLTVSDPTDRGPQPRGKQVTRPGGIFYRPTSGIWQTVWMETVPATHIERVDVDTWMDGRVRVQPVIKGGASDVRVEIFDGDRLAASGWTSPEAPGPIELTVARPKLWSPESPFLYRMRVTAGKDVVNSYVGIREVSLVKNAAGQPQFALNGKPVFMWGLLDQGFWPDGLYTAPTDEALKYDIQVTKDLGFNTIRKHVKVEPARWYYWADKIGVFVIQDMPSGDRSIGPSDPDIQRTPQSREIYERELKAMMDFLRNHPSVVTWVPFNEGWGQFDTARITDWIKEYDPSRLVISASGWTDRETGDFHDVHIYPGPGAPPKSQTRASFLGEFGGLGLVVPGHTWQKDGWGYQSYKTKEELTRAIESNFFNLRLLRESAGLTGAIYTQTTDVETELNGLLTYDRAMIKPDAARLKRAIALVHRPAPAIAELVPTSQESPVNWQYTTAKPADNWFATQFNDDAWQTGPAGFGTPETPGAIVRTRWDTSDIWLRRTFDLAAPVDADDLYLKIHHDDDVEVYLDGKLILAKSGWTTGYTLMKWPGTGTISAGSHTLAVYCHQNRGGQYIDVGIMQIKE